MSQVAAPAATASAATESSQQTLPPQVQYQQVVQECNQLMQKVAELEVDRNEHALVLDTLEPLEGSRRAYRLVGDVLVERSVQEVMPSVKANKDNLEATIDALKERLTLRQKEAADLKTKYNLQ